MKAPRPSTLHPQGPHPQGPHPQGLHPRELRPIAEIAQRPRVLLFDVDDTVTTDGRVEAVAIDALEVARSAGLRTVAVTGRPLGWAEVIAWTWPVDLAIGENGAGWMWRVGRGLETRHFDTDSVRGAQRARLDQLTERMAAHVPTLALAGDGALRRCDAAWDVGETRVAPEEEVGRAVELICAAGMRSVRSSVHLHAVPGAWDKALGARRALADRFGLSAEEAKRGCAFVGDSGNDAEAFGFFDTSVGVANVTDHLARLTHTPRFITESPRGRGFAELVGRLLEIEASDG